MVGGMKGTARAGRVAKEKHTGTCGGQCAFCRLKDFFRNTRTFINHEQKPVGMEALECFWRLFFCCPRKGSPLPGTRIIQTIAHELKEFAYPEAWMIAALETQLIGFSTPLTEL